MKKEDIKVGTKLVAIDRGRINCLTLGKEYEIVNFSEKSIAIIDDQDNNHEFTFDRLDEFFKLQNDPKDNLIGIKESEDKLDYEFDLDFLDLMSERMVQNKHKYPPYNWTKEIDVHELLKANVRHAIKALRKYRHEMDLVKSVLAEQDPESIQDHIVAESCNAAMINYQLKNKS